MDIRAAKKIREYFQMAADVAIEENAWPSVVVMSLPTGMLMIGGPGAPRKVTRQRLMDAHGAMLGALPRADDRFGVVAYFYQAKDIIVPDDIVH